MSERGGNADHVIVKLYIDISKYNFYNNGHVKTIQTATAMTERSKYERNIQRAAGW